MGKITYEPWQAAQSDWPQALRAADEGVAAFIMVRQLTGLESSGGLCCGGALVIDVMPTTPGLDAADCETIQPEQWPDEDESSLLSTGPPGPCSTSPRERSVVSITVEAGDLCGVYRAERGHWFAPVPGGGGLFFFFPGALACFRIHSGMDRRTTPQSARGAWIRPSLFWALVYCTGRNLARSRGLDLGVPFDSAGIRAIHPRQIEGTTTPTTFVYKTVSSPAGGAPEDFCGSYG